MRELELREKKVNDVQATGDKLLRDGHPARTTIEVGHNNTPILCKQLHRPVEITLETHLFYC